MSKSQDEEEIGVDTDKHLIKHLEFKSLNESI